MTAFAADQDTLYLVSYRDAPRSQVLAVSFADPDLSRARSVVSSGARAVEAVQVTGGHLLVRDLDGDIGRLRRVPLAGGEPQDVPMPIEGGILEWTGHPDRPEVLLLVSTWTDAPQVYGYDGHTAALANTGLAPRSPLDFGEMDARMLQAPARDGTLIPVTVVHRKGLPLDGGNPTLLTGYGSYGLTDLPEFRPEMLAWSRLVASTPSPISAAAARTAGSGTRPGVAGASTPPSPTSSTARVPHRPRLHPSRAAGRGWRQRWWHPDRRRPGPSPRAVGGHGHARRDGERRAGGVQ